MKEAGMEREPAKDAAREEAEVAGGDTEEEPKERSGKRAEDPKIEDDGSVPRKHISRWKGEGGSWLPTD